MWPIGFLLNTHPWDHFYHAQVAQSWVQGVQITLWHSHHRPSVRKNHSFCFISAWLFNTSLFCVNVMTKVIFWAKYINFGSCLKLAFWASWFPFWYIWGWEPLVFPLQHHKSLHTEKMEGSNVEQEARKSSSELCLLRVFELCLMHLLWIVTYFKGFSQIFFNIFMSIHATENSLWHYQVSFPHTATHYCIKSSFHTTT